MWAELGMARTARDREREEEIAWRAWRFMSLGARAGF